MIRLVFTQQKHDRRRNRYFAESKLAELSSPRVDKSEAKASCIWNILHKLSNLCQYACVSGSQSCGESYLPAGCQIPAFPLLASSAAAQRDLASIAITLASITPGQDLLPPSCPPPRMPPRRRTTRRGWLSRRRWRQRRLQSPRKRRSQRRRSQKLLQRKRWIFFLFSTQTPFPAQVAAE